MCREEILTTVHIAHYFDSAFTAEETYALLRTPMSKAAYQQTLQQLLREGLLQEWNDTLFARDLHDKHRRQQENSRTLFARYRQLLRGLAAIPGVRFLTLTGANAFESCKEPDDLDIFVICSRQRLWISYLLMVIYSKLTGQRDTLCINYLVDEDNLRIPRETYFTAVQLVRMIPLLKSDLGQALLDANPWVFEHLPNAPRAMFFRDEYLLYRKNVSSKKRFADLPGLNWLNRRIYRSYRRRLKRKYPEAYGQGIVLREGAAKLNRINHERIYHDIFERISTELIHD